MIYTCKIHFQQPTTAALMECATLCESGSHIHCVSKKVHLYDFHDNNVK